MSAAYDAAEGLEVVRGVPMVSLEKRWEVEGEKRYGCSSITSQFVLYFLILWHFVKILGAFLQTYSIYSILCIIRDFFSAYSSLL